MRSGADLSAWCLFAACCALALAAVNPVVERQRPIFNLVVSIDITQSMNALDYRADGEPVSRINRVKRALEATLTELPCGSRIGWAIFTEYRSFLLTTPVEVCANYRELRATLGHIDGRMAWAGASEVAKGLYSGLLIARQLKDKPDLVFVTDGHEAPPLNPGYRPTFAGVPGEIGGAIIGVGGDALAPIPKFDADGKSLGVWQADEVLQTDPRSLGRGGSVAGEAMVGGGGTPPDPRLLAAPGREHLSSLREEYLKLLASETGLFYSRLGGERSLNQQLTSLARPLTVAGDLRDWFGGAALILLVASYLAFSIERARERAWRLLRLFAPAISRRRTSNI